MAIAPVLKTGVRKDIRVRIPGPPFLNCDCSQAPLGSSRGLFALVGLYLSVVGPHLSLSPVCTPLVGLQWTLSPVFAPRWSACSGCCHQCSRGARGVEMRKAFPRPVAASQCSVRPEVTVHGP